VIGKLLDVHGLTVRQRMVAPDGEHAGLAGEGRPDHEVGLFQRNPSRHQLDLGAAQTGQG
jgi:hypothetical protein